MVYQRDSSINSFRNRGSVVQYVYDKLHRLPRNSAWTMTITRGRSGDYSVRTVIEESSEGIAGNSGELKFSDEHHST